MYMYLGAFQLLLLLRLIRLHLITYHPHLRQQQQHHILYKYHTVVAEDDDKKTVTILPVAKMRVELRTPGMPLLLNKYSGAEAEAQANGWR